jgi:hypothetical protein
MGLDLYEQMYTFSDTYIPLSILKNTKFHPILFSCMVDWRCCGEILKYLGAFQQIKFSTIINGVEVKSYFLCSLV